MQKTQKNEAKNKTQAKLFSDILIITIGLLISSIGTAMFYQANLGSSPMATLCDGLHIIMGISYGTANTMANIVLLLVLVILKKEYINIGTIMCVALIGPFIDLCTPLIAILNIGEANIIIRIIFVILGTIFMGIGLGLYVAVERGYGALEALVKYFCFKTSLSYSKVKIGQDILLVLVGTLLTATWGLGTIIAVFLTGPVLQKSIKFFTKILSISKETKKI